MASIISAGTTVGTALNVSGDTSGALQLATNGTTTAMTISTAQNVGIGTTSPSTKLQVSAATPVVTVTGTGTTASSQDFTTNGAAQRATIGVEQSTGGGLFVGSSAYAAVFGSAGASSTQFASNNNVRATINSAGEFLIGSTSSNPFTTKLYVNGSVSAQLQYGPMFISNEDNTDNVGRASFSYRRGGTEVGFVSTSNSTTTYNTSSDYRLKLNVQSMTGALAKVAQLRPVTYKWKRDGTDGQGFIAHELQEIIPESVSGIKDAVDQDGNPVHQGVDTSFLVATLTAAIQELKAINDTQAATLTQQTEAINALTARIVALESRGTV